MLPGAQGLQIEFSLASKSQPLPLDPLDWIPNVVSQISQIYPDIMVAQFAKTWRWHTLATCSRSRSCGRHFAREVPLHQRRCHCWLLQWRHRWADAWILLKYINHQGMPGKWLEDWKMAGSIRKYIFGNLWLSRWESLKTCILACRFDTTCGLVDQVEVKENLAHLCCNSQSVRKFESKQILDVRQTWAAAWLIMGFPWDFHGIFMGFPMGFPWDFPWDSYDLPIRGKDPLIPSPWWLLQREPLELTGPMCCWHWEKDANSKNWKRGRNHQKSIEIHWNPLKSCGWLDLVGPSGT